MTNPLIIRPSEPIAPLSKEALVRFQRSIALSYVEHLINAAPLEYPDLPRGQQTMMGIQCAIDTLHWVTDWARDYVFSIHQTESGLDLRMDLKTTATETMN